MLDEGDFWGLVAASRRDDLDTTYETLVQSLSHRPVEMIHLFHQRWVAVVGSAYRWDLWGAAYIINGGASDDGFEYFRDWLILQGQEVFSAALADPDSLSAIVSEDSEAQYECYPAQDAWERATGNTDPEAFYVSEAETLERLGLEAARRFDPRGPAGEEWDFDDRDEMVRRYPQLSARLL